MGQGEFMNLDAIGIISSDIGETIRFYKYFGINLKPCGGPDHYEAHTESGVRLMVDTVKLIKEINPQWNESQGSRIVLCFKKESANEVNELHKTLVQNGAQSVKEPWDAFWGQRYSSVLDPDGNQVDIFANI